MTLPPIPEEAVQAVLRTFLPEGRGFEEAEGDWVREDLTAAWPHLYAAALRHAASRITPTYEDNASDLLRWADEALEET